MKYPRAYGNYAKAIDGTLRTGKRFIVKLTSSIIIAFPPKVKDKYVETVTLPRWRKP
jgi:hypothetical protein